MMKMRFDPWGGGMGSDTDRGRPRVCTRVLPSQAPRDGTQTPGQSRRPPGATCPIQALPVLLPPGWPPCRAGTPIHGDASLLLPGVPRAQ